MNRECSCIIPLGALALATPGLTGSGVALFAIPRSVANANGPVAGRYLL
jgi:hypothetical protein